MCTSTAGATCPDAAPSKGFPARVLPRQAATKTGNTAAAPSDWADADEVQEWVGLVLDDTVEGVDAALDAHKRGGAAQPADRLPSGGRTSVAIGQREWSVTACQQPVSRHASAHVWEGRYTLCKREYMRTSIPAARAS